MINHFIDSKISELNTPYVKRLKNTLLYTSIDPKMYESKYAMI